MPKIFKIETRQGFFSLPEKIGNYSFPMSCAASFKGASEFFTMVHAQKVMKKYHLDKNPYFGHIEEFEYFGE